MIDLVAWSDRVRRSSEQFLERFEERYGYPPDVNVVVTGTGQGGSKLSLELGPDIQVPPSIVEFFNVVEEVSLPNVRNGYFLGPATSVAAKHAEKYPRWLELGGRRVEILTIGSDGGGALYVGEWMKTRQSSGSRRRRSSLGCSALRRSARCKGWQRTSRRSSNCSPAVWSHTPPGTPRPLSRPRAAVARTDCAMRYDRAQSSMIGAC